VKQRFIAAESAHGVVETEISLDTLLKVRRCRAIHVVDRASQCGDGLSPVGLRRQLAGCQGLKGGTNVEDVSDFLGVEMAVSHDGRASSVNLAAAQIAQLSPAEPTDVTVNSCVRIRPTRDSADSQNPVARMVVIGTPPGGQCASSTPSNTTEPVRAGLHGAVTAVGSGTLTVDGTTVSVNQATRYVKRSAATIQTVANGQCMTTRRARCRPPQRQCAPL
jgi:Domain of unknown function (DUF5666)